MFRLAVLACVFVAALAQFDAYLDGEWAAYKVAYNKVYDSPIEPIRRLIWEKNVKLIATHNLEADRGLHTYRLGMNEYGDMSVPEFVAFMNGYKQNISRSNCGHYSSSVAVADLPSEVDWTTKGYVTGIKNQKQCGSCWAFSTTGSLEGQHFKKTGNLVSLSEQNLMDCSRKEGNMGCEGGLMDQAFAYVESNGGIDTESSYPYEARDESCRFKKEDIGATETSCMDISKGSESDLQKAVADIGPISVAIDASHSSFQLYRSGVYNERRCSSSRLDHGVLAVGYGTQGGTDYWKVKNSWGTSWGMNGYILMSRNRQNQCGIATAASFPSGVGL